MTAGELRQLAASSAVEVQRVCTLFHGLQQLVMAQSEPHLLPMPILPVLTEAIDGVNLLFQNDGICLNLKIPETSPPVLIDHSRTLHALSRVMLLAHSLSSRQDTVKLTTSQSENSIQITLANQNLTSKQISPEMNLSMAIAAAHIQRQQARFDYSWRPFRVDIEFSPATFAY
jgi:hypothetical protein